MKKRKEFSKVIKALRVNAGLSQKDVSKRLGYGTSQFVSNWERGMSFPPSAAVPILALAYKVSVEELTDILIDAEVKAYREGRVEHFKKAFNGIGVAM